MQRCPSGRGRPAPHRAAGWGEPPHFGHEALAGRQLERGAQIQRQFPGNFRKRGGARLVAKRGPDEAARLRTGRAEVIPRVDEADDQATRSAARRARRWLAGRARRLREGRWYCRARHRRTGGAPGNVAEPAFDARTVALAAAALQAALDAGASYADVRIGDYRTQALRTREARVVSVNDNDSRGFGMRVHRQGTWGFAASVELLGGGGGARGAARGGHGQSELGAAARARATRARRRRTWQPSTPLRRDPFDGAAGGEGGQAPVVERARLEAGGGKLRQLGDGVRARAQVLRLHRRLRHRADAAPGEPELQRHLVDDQKG